MMIYYALAATLLIAALALIMAWRGSAKRHWSLWVLFTSLAAFIYLYGCWVFLSVYCKYLFACCFLIAAAVPLMRRKKPVTSPASLWKVIAHMALSAPLLLLVLLYFTGTARHPYGTARLAPPFRHGSYFVLQGGRGRPTNFFHRSRYAMDIIKLNSAGARGRHIFSPTLTDYAIYSDTLYSPCSGTILQTHDDNPDNIPPSRRRGPTNLNMVLIGTPHMYIFMGHLQQGKVFVKAGDSITTGQPLGLAGNSGNSIEPHLHIQAHARTTPGQPWYAGPQLLIEFYGKEYRLFEVMDVK